MSPFLPLIGLLWIQWVRQKNDIRMIVDDEGFD